MYTFNPRPLSTANAHECKGFPAIFTGFHRGFSGISVLPIAGEVGISVDNALE